MWKLFPTTWIERAGVFRHRHAAPAEAFEKNWLAWLEGGLRRVRPQTLHAQGSDPVQALRTLSGSALLELDETLRGHTFRNWQPTASPSSLGMDDSDEALADAYLFVAACNPSGFVRERALMVFARYPGPLALAVGLIRSTDWVAQVRSEAILLVRRITPDLAPAHLVRLLDLVVRLKGRVRVDEDLWQAFIDQRLKAAECRHALWVAACDRSGSNLLRRCAFEYLMLGDPPSVSQVLESALADPDLRVGLWALAQLGGLAGAEERTRLLRLALDAKHSVVRRAALRQYASMNPDDCEHRLRAALFDSSRGVRAFAAFELKRTRGVSALPIWRSAVKHPDRDVSEVAILALCESGEQSDVEKLASDGVVPNARLRASVLRGLWRVGSSHLESHLTSALSDRSTFVIRQAAQIYRRGTITLTSRTLETAIANAPESLAPYLLALSNSLGKWEELELLLQHVLSENAALASRAADHLDHWILTSQRRFTVPSAAQVERLLLLSRAARARYPDRRWRSIDLDLAAFDPK
jgi:hypothetical protein